ncbi:MAG: hypothetical protein GX996_03890 [Firmicutes bacterium]|nr:hypothetical protein [Bacillota bacterium]
MKVISLQEKKREKIEENLHVFQEHFWEWVFAFRWKPCPECTRLLLKLWRHECLWSNLCGVCSSYFYYYQVLYVKAIKTVCQRGKKVPTFRELEKWYFQQEQWQK